MDTGISGLNEGASRSAENLQALRRFEGAPREFWQRFLEECGQMASASVAVLIVERTGQPGKWVRAGEWISGAGSTRQRDNFMAFSDQLADRCAQSGPLIEEEDETAGAFSVALPLRLAGENEKAILALYLVDFTAEAAADSLGRLLLVADTPALYQEHTSASRVRGDVEKFATVLDLLVPVNSAKRFLGCALALCNGVSTRFRCDRVSLGWVEGGFIKLKAISRTEKIDRKMVAAQLLETAMEEALDQDEEIVAPAPEGFGAITRDHERYAAELKPGNLCSVPLRAGDKPVAILTCERADAPFGETELKQLRLLCDQAVARLDDLKRFDRWFGARWAAWTREQMSTFLGPEHTWAKALAIGMAVLMVLLFLVPFPYRVEGNFILKSDEVAYLTAPFDGYIESVAVRPGDLIAAGSPLMQLDRSELLLEESAALADVGRFDREAEKARADKELAAMRIAQSQTEQARSRLALIRHRLEHSTIRTPFAAVVVEGDLRERIAAPVKQGDAMYKVARIDDIYVEAEVPERDVKRILSSKKGEIAFLSQPKSKYRVEVIAVEPAAIPKKDGNVFLVRLRLAEGAQDWWRPGMTGLCKISSGYRNLFWILTHRTIDFLRMALWW